MIHANTPVRTAVLCSGRGSNLRALLDASRKGKLPNADIRLVLSNQPGAGALTVARQFGVRAEAVDHKPFRGDRAAHEEALLKILREEEIQFLVLAGYMRLLTPTLIRAYDGAMINIHPSLLPAFKGAHAQREAAEYGVRFSGCTVHFVTEEMDAGAIILQRVVPVLPDDSEDTLAARILVEEHLALPTAVDLYTSGRLRLQGRKVAILPGTGPWDNLLGNLPQAPDLLIATGNMHKVKEISAILREVSLHFRSTAEFPDYTEPQENAPDYEGNARIKALTWRGRTGLWTLADDSGIEVDALNGRPGIHSARYAATAEDRNRKLLTELTDVPPEKRTARFVCAMVLVSPEGTEYTSRGVLEGRIGPGPRGAQGFGYDPIFIPEGFGGRHLAELDESTKNNISHRARALFGLKPVLERLAKGRM